MNNKIIIFEKNNWLHNTVKNPFLWKIDQLSILEMYIRDFGEENIIYVSKEPHKVKTKYSQISIIQNHLIDLTGDIFALFLQLKQITDACFIISEPVYIKKEILDQYSKESVSFVNITADDIGVFFFNDEFNKELLMQMFHADFNWDISTLVNNFTKIKTIELDNDDYMYMYNPYDYLKLVQNYGNIRYEDLNENNIEETAEFYMNQPLQIRKHFKPHSFDREKLLSLVDHPNVYVCVRRNNQIVGYGLLQGLEYEDKLPSLGFIVNNSERGTASSFSLAVHLLNRAKELGCNGVIGNVDISNLAATHFDKNLGFDFQFVKNARIYLIINFYGKKLSIPQRYVENTGNKRTLNLFRLEKYDKV